MKFFPLVWAGLWRKRVRTVLTMLSVAIAFWLYGTLDGVTAAFDDALDFDDERGRACARRAASTFGPACRSRTAHASRACPACGTSA